MSLLDFNQEIRLAGRDCESCCNAGLKGLKVLLIGYTDLYRELTFPLQSLQQIVELQRLY
jgi:hypothetical protein